MTQILSGSIVPDDPSLFSALVHSSITSVNVERFFSVLKRFKQVRPNVSAEAFNRLLMISKIFFIPFLYVNK